MREHYRKAYHLAYALSLAALILTQSRTVSLTLLVLLLFVVTALCDIMRKGYHLPFAPTLDRLIERPQSITLEGTVLITISVLGSYLFFRVSTVFYAIIVLAILDTSTALYGKRYGKRRIYNGKSLEGSLFGFLVTTGALLLIAPPTIALIATATGCVIELLTPINDNLIIIPSICLILFSLP